MCTVSQSGRHDLKVRPYQSKAPWITPSAGKHMSKETEILRSGKKSNFWWWRKNISWEKPWNIYGFCTFHSNKNANNVTAFNSHSTDIYQIEFCYLTFFCKYWHYTHIFNRFQSVLLQLNVSTGNVISYYGWKCTCTSCAAKHKGGISQNPRVS